MRLLILGGSGMLGHQLWRSLNNKHQVWVTLRRPATNYTALKLFDLSKSIQVRDITDRDVLEKVFKKAKPEAVINCVGIIKQLNEAKDETIIHRINAEFPHHLAKQCKAMGARLIHFSTDCVFNGIKGKYPTYLRIISFAEVKGASRTIRTFEIKCFLSFIRSSKEV